MAARSPAFRRGEDEDDDEDDDDSSVESSRSAGATAFSSSVSDGATVGAGVGSATSALSVSGASPGEGLSDARTQEVESAAVAAGRVEEISAATGGAGSASASLPPSAFREGSEALSTALLETIRPPLAAISGRLVELQEAQQMLVTTIGVQRAELTEANSDWATAKSVLDRIPEYMAKVARLKKSMAAAEAAVVKAQRGAAALRSKAEAAEAARLQKRAATASSFANVSAQ